jgi:hypothetical protein
MPTTAFTPIVTIIAPTATTATTGTWQEVGKGVQFLQSTRSVNGADDWVSVVRIDLTQAKLQVRYAPEAPRGVRAWQLASEADAVINAGFFNEQKQATGLVIADGKRFGQTYRGFGGMFSVRASKPQLQWLASKPYAQDSQITQAVQSFPMLLVNGQVVDGIPDNGERNRRSFVGIDRQGRVVLGVCHSPVWTMTDLARYLATDKELNLRDALNLDGGASTGLWVRDISEPMLVDSVEAVPAVITINGR